MTKIKVLSNRLLVFLGLTDKSHNLSITNIAVIVLITRMAIAPFDWPTSIALLFAMLNYIHKRSQVAKAVKDQEQATSFTEIKEEMLAVRAKLEKFEVGYAVIAKQADDTKKLLSQSNVNHAFGARRGTASIRADGHGGA